MKWILNKIFKEVVEGIPIIIGDILEHIQDPRDFRYSLLGGIFDYKPKHRRLLLPVLDIKAQYPNNTCVFHSYASCREPDEGVVLSPRSLVAYAKKRGYLTRDGISSIRNGQKAGIEFGIAEDAICPNVNLPWDTYSGLQLSDDLQKAAARHKAKSTFWVNSKNEWLKALDDGHSVHTGFDWYSAYNMNGGLSAPWCLKWRKGFKVGGHAVRCCGYDLDHPAGEVYIFQNSFGKSWGENGLFYVRMSDIHREGIEGACAVDLDGDLLEAFIASHEGLDVKSNAEPTIYRIQDGKKRPFLDVVTFYAWGGHFPTDGQQSFSDVSKVVLEKMPLGEPMKAEDSIFWPKLKDYWQNIQWQHYPDNVTTIKTLIQE